MKPIYEMTNEELVNCYRSICATLDQWEAFKEQARKTLSQRWEAGMIAAKLNVEGGTLARRDGRITYTHSEEVKKREDWIKRLKQDEIANGIATPKQGEASWQFTKSRTQPNEAD
jgi:hypothetical protein